MYVNKFSTTILINNFVITNTNISFIFLNVLTRLMMLMINFNNNNNNNNLFTYVVWRLNYFLVVWERVNLIFRVLTLAHILQIIYAFFDRVVPAIAMQSRDLSNRMSDKVLYKNLDFFHRLISSYWIFGLVVFNCCVFTKVCFFFTFYYNL